MSKLKILLIIALLQALSTAYAQSLLKVNGTKIVNESNEEVILKCINLSNWFVQEGYMMLTPSGSGAEHAIRQKISELVGESLTDSFYHEYHRNYIRKPDIDKIAQWGFNSIRLPLHYNKLVTSENGTFKMLDYGLQFIDNVINWCKANHLYLILDLHAAPGGQAKTDYADYDASKSTLWDSEFNQNMTIFLWKNLAARYSTESIIAGYDLINETAIDLGSQNAPLRNLYINITNAIREVDQNHILFIEGNWYANDFNGLTPPWDNNMVYSFHKYWNGTDKNSIQWLLDLRESAQRPIWLGETGENSNEWLRQMVKLMNANDIGWAVWPQKKLSSVVGPLSVPVATGYQKILDYWNGKSSKPTPADAFKGLLDEVSLTKFENCTENKGYIDALMRQPYHDTTESFTYLDIPGTFFATDYNQGAQNIAYSDNDYMQINGTSQTVWNQGWIYRNDGVDIEKCTDNYTNGYNVGWIQSGEWVTYTVYAQKTGSYNVRFRVASNSAEGKISLLNGDTVLIDKVSIPNTGGWQTWQSVDVPRVNIHEGLHEFKLRFDGGNFNLNYIEFTRIGPLDIKNISQGRDSLCQNFPNPFWYSTKIPISLANESNVKLIFYNGLGKEIETVAFSKLQAGLHYYQWVPKTNKPGVFFCKMQTQNGSNCSLKLIFNGLN